MHLKKNDAESILFLFRNECRCVMMQRFDYEKNMLSTLISLQEKSKKVILKIICVFYTAQYTSENENQLRIMKKCKM